MTMKLKSKIALITGASQGLGKAIASAFVKEGSHVAICARDGELIELVAEDFRAQAVDGQKVFAAACDVSSSDQVDRLFSDIFAHLGSVEILVNNAGVSGPKGESETVGFADWSRAIEINLYGTFLPCQYGIRHMKKIGRGKIINLSGGGATAPMPKISAYAASKAAVVRLTETLAEELRAFSIDVNAVAPGALNTRFLDELLAAGPETVGRKLYDKALQQRSSGGVPLEKGARLCVYLASQQSDGITGKLISAQWDHWENLHDFREHLDKSDIYTLRRIVPEDRGLKW
jgi:NAD(P)-dependent dehydrogenase (short-subunit alcohol dehydrogenase family)